MLSLMLTCVVFGAAQVLVSTHASPVLGGLTIPVLAAVTLRIRPKGFAHA
jgi:branched-chain amino acid transport system permease protein